MNKKMLALYGLKWNPFAPDVPVEALHVSRRTESFCWRAEQLVGDGGFALVTGAPGTGKSVTLRILADRLEAKRDVKVGIVSRPQSGLSDFYREMGDLFGVCDDAGPLCLLRHIGQLSTIKLVRRYGSKDLAEMVVAAGKSIPLGSLQ